MGTELNRVTVESELGAPGAKKPLISIRNLTVYFDLGRQRRQTKQNGAGKQKHTADGWLIDIGWALIEGVIIVISSRWLSRWLWLVVNGVIIALLIAFALYRRRGARETV